ncbi:peroxiredoxin family protein [Algoriphagus jejuensis]
MRRFCGFILFLLLFSFSCSSPETPEAILNGAKEKIFSANRLSFNQLMFWENPELDEVDTFSLEILLRKNPETELGFDYLGKREGSGYNFIEGVLFSISHKDSIVTYYPEKNISRMNQSSMYLTNSPIRLLKNGPWNYLGDTAIDGKTYSEFLWIEMDTTIMEKKVLLKNHLFINPSNELADFYSRRLYHDGKKNQFIDVYYSSYEFDELGEELVYEIPQGYVSKVWGQKDPEAAQVLSKGDLAHDFQLADENGGLVRLSDFRGKKVLLDFSMINCGWCKIALEQFNKPDYQFAENIVPLYVNPVDSKEKMDKYRSKVAIPFPVLINAEEIGKAYGVSGYPTFFLIDENGKVEDVVVGFIDEEILKWKKGVV